MISKFWKFYENDFKKEHTVPLNIALHVLGTLSSVFFVCWVLWTGRWFMLILYPVVHAAPGLLGHKLFESNPNVGDLRVFRNDFPGYWFLIGNHVMTVQVMMGAYTQ